MKPAKRKKTVSDYNRFHRAIAASISVTGMAPREAFAHRSSIVSQVSDSIMFDLFEVLAVVF